MLLKNTKSLYCIYCTHIFNPMPWDKYKNFYIKFLGWFYEGWGCVIIILLLTEYNVHFEWDGTDHCVYKSKIYKEKTFLV